MTLTARPATMITGIGFWTPSLHDARRLVSDVGWFIVQAAHPVRPLERGDPGYGR